LGRLRFDRATVPALVLALLTALPAAAQSVVGVIVDARTGAPVPGVFLTLIDDEDVAHDTVRTDRRGQFELRAGGLGRYVIGAEREEYASVLSDGILVPATGSVSFTMELPPVSMSNLRQMAETMDRNERLRGGVVELCRGRMNPLEGGILLGVVRESGSGDPVAGAVAHLPPNDRDDVPGTAVTDRHGTYLFCFVPQGQEVVVRVEAEGYRPSEQGVEIRSGTISWYDFRLRPTGGTK